jgi:hypothetical protein
MEENQAFDFLLPIDGDLPYNTFGFIHLDGKDRHVTFFQQDFVDCIIDNFVTFLKGCGFNEESIYELMKDQADSYFQQKDKEKQSWLTEQQHEGLDSDSVLG